MANITLADKAFSEKLYDFAIAQYEKALKSPAELSSSEIEHSQFYLAVSHYLSGDPSTAQNQLSAFQTRYPQSHLAFLASDYKMRIFKDQNASLELLKEGEAALKQFIVEANALNNEGRAQSSAKDGVQAEAATILNIMLQSAETLKELPSEREKIITFIMLVAQARPHLQRLSQSTSAAQNNPYYGDALIIEANLHTLIDQHQNAFPLYREALAYSLTVFTKDTTKLALAKSYLESGNIDAGREILREAYFGSESEAYREELGFWLAHISYLEEKYSRAVLAYKDYLAQEGKSLVGKPYAVEATLYLALAYQQIGQSVLAVKTLQTVLREPSLLPYHYRANKIAYTLYELIDDPSSKSKGLLESVEELLRLAKTPEERLFALEKSILFTSTTGVLPSYADDPLLFIERRLDEWNALQQSVKQTETLLLRAAHAAYDNSQFQIGLVLFEKGYGLSQNIEFKFALIEGLIEQEKPQEALSHARKLESDLQRSKQTTETTANLAYVYDLAGFIFIQLRDHEQAVQYYEKNLNANDPTLRINAAFYLGESFRLQQQYPEAIEAYERVKHLLSEMNTQTSNADNAGGNAGNARNARNETADASPSTQLTPEESNEFLFKSELQLGQIREVGLTEPALALEHYAEAIRLAEKLNRPDEKSRLHLIRGHLYQRIDKDNLALAELRKVSTTDSMHYYPALLLIASIEFNRERYTQSLSYYIRIINNETSKELPPSAEVLEQAYYERILVKLKTRSPNEAYYYLGKMEQRFPESTLLTEAYASIADFFYNVKKLDLAVKVYLESAAQAQRLNNTAWEIEALFNAARAELAYNASGSTNLAASRLQTVIDLSEREAQFSPIYLEACFEAGFISAAEEDHVQARAQFSKILTHANTVTEQFPASSELVTSLSTQAQENIERIDAFLKGSPYNGLQTVREVKARLQTISSPELKAEGASHIIRLHIASNELDEALAYLKYAEALWPLPKSTAIDVMKALITKKKYDALYTMTIEYFLSAFFEQEKQHQEFLYYAAALSAAESNHPQDSLRFKKKLQSEFPYSAYLKNLN